MALAPADQNCALQRMLMAASVKTAEAAGACVTLAGKQVTCIEKFAVLTSGQKQGSQYNSIEGLH